MGILLNKPLCTMVVRYLRTQFEKGTENVFLLDHGDFLFHINKVPGAKISPKFWLLMQNCTMTFSDDIQIDANPFRFRLSKITFNFERILLTCERLDYSLRITGRITLLDVFVTVNFKTQLNNGLTVSDLDANIVASRIMPYLSVNINNVNHSTLVNILLNIKNPAVASNLLNAIFMISKIQFLKYLNMYIQQMMSSESSERSSSSKG